MELLKDYAAHDSEAAFAQLVSRHLNLVYSVALRHVGNPHQAEEITQAVFIILARKAGSLREGTVLSAWLFHTARFTAANFLRTETRRAQREQEAFMQSQLSDNGNRESWRQIAPLLDEAIASLGEADRNAVVLRFVEGREFKDVGAALGVTEDGVRMRVNRALEKLRKFFVKRGVILTAAAIAGALSANAVQAAPAALAGTVTTAAVVKGISASASTATLIKGTIKLMAWAKLKTAVVTGAVVILAAGTATVAGWSLLAAPASAGGSLNPVLSVAGVFTSHRDATNGMPAHEQDWGFTLMADKAGRWKMEVQTQTVIAQEPVETTQWITFDGTNIYSVLHSPKTISTGPGGVKVLPATNEGGPAQISAGPYPVDYFQTVGTIWLAYLGGEFLDASKSPARFPNFTVSNARTDPLAWSCEMEYKLAGTGTRQVLVSGRFRLNPAWLHDSASEYPELDEPDNEQMRNNFKSELGLYRTLEGNDLVRAVFQLDASNVVNGILVPTRFHVDLPPAFPKGPAAHYSITATNLPLTNGVELMPPLKGRVSVQDRRLRFKNGETWRRDAFYELGSGGWPMDTNDARIQDALTRTGMPRQQSRN